MVLYQGRPQSCEGRPAKEIKTYDFLDALNIPYLRTDHEPADTMEACRRIDACLDTEICKNLFLCNRQKTDFYMLVMPGDKPFKTKELSAQLHTARLSFGTPEDMEKLLDITPGSVSVMGLINDRENKVQLLMDSELKGREWFGCHPCINTSSLKLKTKDLMDVFLPAVQHEPIFVTLSGKD